MYGKILVPLDGSTLAECALTHVKNLVKEGGGGEVTLLNVVNAFIAPPEGMALPYDETAISHTLLQGSKNYLEEVASRLVAEGVRVKTASLEGRRPAETISDYARKNGVDLIVMATHGYSGLRRLMLGSVALGILHESHIPVFLIRPEACRQQT